MTLNRRIGKHVQTYRANKNLSQTQLAKRLGLTRGFLSDIERGARNISIQTLVKICKRLRLEPSTLLGT